MKSQRGSALVELTVTLPVLLLIVLGTADFGRVFYRSIEVTNAARAAAQYGARDGSDAAGMRTAAVIAAPNINLTTGDVDASIAYQCANSSGTTFTTASGPSDPCAGKHLIKTATVTVTSAFNPFTRFPGIPRALTLTRTASLRAQ
jgi:Flp pilus assembly protein TadG